MQQSGHMGVLADLYDDTPRVRLLEALMDLAPIEFTASQAAKEVGEHRASFYRVIEEIERDGLIVKVSENPVKYRVNEENVRFQIIAAGEAALRIVEAAAPEDSAVDVRGKHRDALRRATQRLEQSASTAPPEGTTSAAHSQSFVLVAP